MLGRAHLQAIEKLIKSGNLRVNKVKHWQEICEQENIGHLSGNFIEFTSKEIQLLRKMIVESVGIDLQEQTLKGNRTDITALVNNEKLSNEAPFASALLFATKRTDGIPCLDRCYECPPHGFVGLDLDDLDVAAIEKLVVIENGRAFLDWHLFNFPPDLDSAIFVYRGHGSNAKALAQLLRSLKESAQKIGFFDYDPAGIEIASTSEVDFILVPELAKCDQLLSKINKKSSIAHQQFRIRDGYLSFNNGVRSQYEFLITNNLSITQEAMAKYNVPLSIFGCRD